LHGYPTRKIEGGKQSAQNPIESIKKNVPNAEVTVFVLNPKTKEYEAYTKMEVSKSDADSTEFRIYWLSPNQDYIVEIDFDPDLENGFEFSEQVNDLDPGEVRDLRLGVEI